MAATPLPLRRIRPKPLSNFLQFLTIFPIFSTKKQLQSFSPNEDEDSTGLYSLLIVTGKENVNVNDSGAGRIHRVHFFGHGTAES
jgi:hypothetical protein